MPPKKLPVGLSDFFELVRKEDPYLFVDKTLFIEKFLKSPDKVTLLLRPRRWGKTLMMSTLYHFLAPKILGRETTGLFDGLKIATFDNGAFLKEHQGKYQVIFISFKDIESDRYEGAINRIKIIIQNLYREHRLLFSASNLAEEDKSGFEKFLMAIPTQEKLIDSIRFLSELLFKYYQKPVYILIDEYDKPMNTAYEHGYLDEMAAFMKGLMGAALKDNSYLAKGLLTGVLRISKDSMLSSLNNLKVYSVFDSGYSDYYGFTEEDVIELLKECHLEDKLPEIREWYDGYTSGESVVYNPWAIINCLSEDGRIACYWAQTSSDELLMKILPAASKEIKEKLIRLMNGEAIEAKVNARITYEGLEKDEAALWALLVFAGYLKVTAVKAARVLTYRCELKIPNQEIGEVYAEIFIACLTRRGIIDDELVVSLTEGRMKDFVKAFKRFLLSVVSIYDMGSDPEAFYQGVVVTLVAFIRSTHYVWPNRESGLGRPDFIIIPKDSAKDLAMIIELKRVHPEKGETLETQVAAALVQIDVNHYKATLSEHQHIKRVLKVGLAFLGKEIKEGEELTDVELAFSSEEEAVSPKKEPHKKTVLTERGFWSRTTHAARASDEAVDSEVKTTSRQRRMHPGKAEAAPAAKRRRQARQYATSKDLAPGDDDVMHKKP